MLELLNIKKDYILKDQEPVHALKGISLAFRKNEFVAILGHSGCGKTTLLNITGGLDHYDDGDLIIKGKSTKNFSEADWDTYRNHSIGFVFQTYNLIPHQTILKNVELALTISGIKKDERISRAKKALDDVGLKGLYSKKPNQLSGGQMQRVAIARALVNNPEIVLADEPTGALDSETSIQIMDLLKEVAKTRLVIMVTHNPELANAYATRIVKMKDGKILSDTMPYSSEEEHQESREEVVEESKGNKKHSSMSFGAAFKLSVSNLISKAKRTILVALAGSIGIIGVSAILGVSCGVNNYIDDMQDDMLSAYPISIKEESVDLTSLLSGLSSQDGEQLKEFDTSTQVGVDSLLAYLMDKYTDITNIKTNEITQTLCDWVNQMPKSDYSAITYDYGIDPTNNIYTECQKTRESEVRTMSINGLTQSYIKTLMSVKDFKEYASYVDLFTGFMKIMPDEEQYILSQYDLLGNSHFATEADEIMLVVDEKTTLTDVVLAQLGLYPQDEFIHIAQKAVAINAVEKDYKNKKIDEATRDRLLQEIEDNPAYKYVTHFDIDEILNHKLTYYPHDSLYKPNPDPDIISHNQVNISLTGRITMGEKIYTIVVSLNNLSASDTLSGSITVIDTTTDAFKVVMTQSLILRKDHDYPVVKENKSVADGKWEISYGGVELSLIIDTFNPVPSIDGSKTNYEATATLTTNMLGTEISIPLTSGSVDEVSPDTPDYYFLAEEDSTFTGGTTVKIAGILRAKSSTNFGTLSRGVYYTKAFMDRYINDASNSNVVNEYKEHIIEKRFEQSLFNVYTIFKYDDYEEDEEHPTEKTGYANALNGSPMSSLRSILFSFASSSTENLDTEKIHLRAISGLKIISHQDKNYPTDITKTSYTTGLLPISISIYPKSFETKGKVTHHLDRWNSNETLHIKDKDVTPEEREDITYTDTISVIVAVINTLVTTISIALIAFTSLSLVVSCFMIAVITYISVMERIKEIGVIRSLGGRKSDVSSLFIAENLITGFSSGAVGILVTYIIQIIINAIVNPLGVSNIAALPWYLALLMIGIAVLLSVISGFIPAMSASQQDPVIALRSE